MPIGSTCKSCGRLTPNLVACRYCGSLTCNQCLDKTTGACPKCRARVIKR